MGIDQFDPELILIFSFLWTRSTVFAYATVHGMGHWRGYGNGRTKSAYSCLPFTSHHGRWIPEVDGRDLWIVLFLLDRLVVMMFIPSLYIY